MPRRLKALGLAAVVAVGVLVPLYGDSQSAPVTHPEWARMLLRALELEDNLPEGASPRLLFATLSWKESLAFPADAYVRARGAEVGTDGARTVVAGRDGAEVAYPLMVVRGGDYRLRVKMAGDPAVPAAAEIRPSGKTEPVEEFTLVPPPIVGWVEAGGTHLDRGAYTAAVVLPAGASLHRLEVAPPCLTAIEPAGGWKSEAVLRSEDAALTMLQALDLQSELPPAAAAIELTASDFRATSTTGAAASEDTALQGLWIKGAPRGLQVLVIVDLPEPGLYTLSVFGLFAGAQSWLADSCHKTILCPTPPAAPSGPAWRPVMTAPFAAGRHSFTVTLAAGAALGRVRIERKKDGPADAMATIKRVGFDVGEAGPMPRARALEAMAFLKDRRARRPESTCGDVLALDTLAAGLAEPAGVRGPGVTPGFSGQPPSDVGVPLPGPVPPGPPPTAPPVSMPPVTPPVVTPPGPPPTVPPGPPPTIPPQPPGSPVTIASPPAEL